MKKISIFQKTTQSVFVIWALLMILSFQNCSQASFQSISMGSTAPPTNTLADGPQTDQVLLGKPLYENKCASCHSSFDASTLKGRTITSALIANAINSKISTMNFLKGSLSNEQLNSIEALFLTTTDTTSPVLTSNFACASTEDEKKSSVDLIRLNGQELRNTYIAILSTGVWSSLANQTYLLPQDKLEGLISNFIGQYTADFTDQISRFNEQVANQVTLNNTNLAAFFGSCATTATFTKTCFDSFLTSKGPLIFRSALASDDNTTIWASISQASSVIDQQKTLVQILFNDPRFLYHLELGEQTAADAQGNLALTSYEVANRIAYGMTAAPADSTLWADAVANKLKTTAAVNAHVDRISQSNAFKNRVIDFVKFYVGISTSGIAPQHAEFLNGIDGTNLEAAVTDEFNEFVKYIVFTQNGTLSDLFSSQAAFPKTTALASIMKTKVWISGAPAVASNHAGILTKPYLNLISNPSLKLVQRGKRIRINMLCTDVPQPSVADLAGRSVLTENDLLTLNRRQYIDKATLIGASCIVCHSKMNQLGYATENYDSIGRYNTIEKIYDSSNVKVAEKPVISSSTPTITENDTRTFANINEFQSALIKTDVMQQCLTRKTFQFFQRKAENFNYDSCRLNKIDTLIKKDRPLLEFLTESFRQTSVLYKRSN